MEAENEKERETDWKTLSIHPDVWDRVKDSMGNTETYNDWCRRALKSFDRVKELENEVEKLQKQIGESDVND